MDREDIIKMAREAGLLTEGEYMVSPYQEAVERFAALVAAAEREACAKVVEDYCGAWDDEGYALAAAIQARGDNE